jgi:hypothetical protein
MNQLLVYPCELSYFCVPKKINVQNTIKINLL